MGSECLNKITLCALMLVAGVKFAFGTDPISIPIFRKHSSEVKEPDSRTVLHGVLRHILVEFQLVFENIQQVVGNNVSKMLLGSLLLFGNNKIEAKLENRAFDLNDALMGEVPYIFQHLLKEVKQKFHALATKLGQYSEEAVTQLNKTVMNHTSKYDWYMTQVKLKMRDLNDVRLFVEVCQAIDRFMKQNSNQLQRCCRITMKPVNMLCHNISSLFKKLLYIIVDAIEHMQICMEDKNSYLEYMAPCIYLAYNDISRVVAKVAQLRDLINKLMPMKVVYTRTCLAVVIVKMNHRRGESQSSLYARL